MRKKKVYATLEIADQEIRLIVLEIFEGRNNVLRVERVRYSKHQCTTLFSKDPCADSGWNKDNSIVPYSAGI